MAEKYNFIRTTDANVAEYLKKLGYQVLSYTNNATVFLNDTNKALNFEKLKDTAYTNKLYV